MRKLLMMAALLYAAFTHAQVPNTLSPAEKVYGLSRFWQEVNYNFVYLDKVDRKMWDSAYKAMIVSVQSTANDLEYFRELERFCALLKDGHTNIFYPQSLDANMLTTNFGKYRLMLTNIDNKAIVTGTNASIKDEIPVGSEIIEVNGLPTAEYRAKYVTPYISSSTDYIVQDYSVSNMLKGYVGSQFKLKIRLPDGQVKSFDLTHALTAEKATYPAAVQRGLLDFKWYDGQTAYVSLNSFGDRKIVEEFKAKLPELYKAKKLIIDLRYNGGGSTNIGFSILQYLTYDTVFQGSRNITREHIATYKAWGSFLQPKDTVNGNADWGLSKEKTMEYYNAAHDKRYHYFDYSPDTASFDQQRLVVPTVILLGHNTASAAEDFLILADGQKHMTKMGQRSFGSTGQPYSFELPGGGSARVCTKKDTYADGREFVGVGIVPDVEVKTTLDDYVKKRDPALEKALEYLKKK